ncbi:MAG: hypothetical protein WB983_06230, partial [Terriglobales bacterium]
AQAAKWLSAVPLAKSGRLLKSDFTPRKGHAEEQPGPLVTRAAQVRTISCDQRRQIEIAMENGLRWKLKSRSSKHKKDHAGLRRGLVKQMN